MLHQASLMTHRTSDNLSLHSPQNFGWSSGSGLGSHQGHWIPSLSWLNLQFQTDLRSKLQFGVVQKRSRLVTKRLGLNPAIELSLSEYNSFFLKTPFFVWNYWSCVMMTDLGHSFNWRL